MKWEKSIIWIMAVIVISSYATALTTIGQKIEPLPIHSFISKGGNTWEKYVSFDVNPFNDSDYFFTIKIDENLKSNITNCMKLSGALRIGCFNNLSIQYSINGSQLLNDTLDGVIDTYPINNLTGKVFTSSNFTNLSKNLTIQVTFPYGWQDGETIKLGKRSINVTSTSSSTLILSGTATTGTITLPTALDRTKTLLSMSINTLSGTSRRTQTGCCWKNQTDTMQSVINCTRFEGAAGADVQIKMYFTYFSDGVYIQDFCKSHNDSSTEQTLINTTIPIQWNTTWINPLGFRMSMSTTSSTETDIAILPYNSSSIEVRRNRLFDPAAVFNQSFQIVNMNDSYVEHFNITTNFYSNFTYVNTSRNFNMSRSILISTFTTYNRSNQIRGDIMMAKNEWVNDSQFLVGYRNKFNSSVNFNATIATEAIQFPIGTRVFNGTALLMPNNFSINITLPTSINLNRSIALGGSYGHVMGGTYTNSSAPGDPQSAALYNLTAGNKIQILRATVSPAYYNYTWFAVEFNNYTASFGTPTNSCTYSTGDWSINMADNCVISITNNLAGNKIFTYGTGSLSFLARQEGIGGIQSHTTSNIGCYLTPTCFVR